MGPGRETDAFRAEQFKLVLEALEWHWGEAYVISVTADGWSAVRRDGRGKPLRADSPDALRDMILADYQARPVPRELPVAEPGEPLG